MNKMESIFRYLENQYETGKEMFQSIDTRIGNYLIITGLFWGILFQAAPSTIKYLRNDLTWSSWLPVTILASFVFANIFLLASILKTLFLFTKMGYAVPGVKKVEEYSKVINSSTVTDKDVLVDLVANYAKAINANLVHSNNRSHHFREVRRSMFCGIIFPVICISLFLIVELTHNL